MNHFQMYHEGNMGMNNMQTGWFSVRNYAQEYYVWTLCITVYIQCIYTEYQL